MTYRRVVGGVAGVVLCIVAVWLCSGSDIGTSTPVDSPVLSKKRAPTPRVENSVPPAFDEELDDLDPKLLRQATGGRLGVELANRVCALCADGTLDDPGCARCGSDGPRARIHMGLVDEEGRELDGFDTEVWVTCDRPGGAVGRTVDKTGFALVPTGDCMVETIRHDGPFRVSSDPLPIQLEAGEEAEVMMEVSNQPWGGVGVTLAEQGPATIIEHVLKGGSADGRVRPGIQVVAIDGAAPAELATSLSGIARAITGPAGSTVELTLYDPLADVQEPFTLELERRPYKAMELGLGWGPPG